MKNKKILVFLACFMMGLYLCSCGKDIQDESTEPVIEESTDVAVDEESDIESQPDEDTTDYIEDVVEVDMDSNDFTNVVANTNDISGDYSLVSYVVDLDNDGGEEAFVLEGFWDDYSDSEPGPKSSFLTSRIWFVDEKGDGTELHDFANDGPVSVHGTLQLITIGDNSYVFVAASGQMAAYDQAIIYTVKNNTLSNVTDLPCYGSKYFVDGEVIWYQEMYGMQIDREPGVPLFESSYTTGHCFIPYRLYYDDSDKTFKLYEAEEVSLEEAEEFTGLDFSDILFDATEYQFILRDNSQLDVNIATACEPSFSDDGESYEFICYSYFLQDNGQWESDDYIEGYYLIDPVYYTSVWEFMY